MSEIGAKIEGHATRPLALPTAASYEATGRAATVRAQPPRSSLSRRLPIVSVTAASHDEANDSGGTTPASWQPQPCSLRHARLRVARRVLRADGCPVRARARRPRAARSTSGLASSHLNHVVLRDALGNAHDERDLRA